MVTLPPLQSGALILPKQLPGGNCTDSVHRITAFLISRRTVAGCRRFKQKISESSIADQFFRHGRKSAGIIGIVHIFPCIGIFVHFVKVNSGIKIAPSGSSNRQVGFSSQFHKSRSIGKARNDNFILLLQGEFPLWLWILFLHVQSLCWFRFLLLQSGILFLLHFFLYYLKTSQPTFPADSIGIGSHPQFIVMPGHKGSNHAAGHILIIFQKFIAALS